MDRYLKDVADMDSLNLHVGDLVELDLFPLPRHADGLRRPQSSKAYDYDVARRMRRLTKAPPLVKDIYFNSEPKRNHNSIRRPHTHKLTLTRNRAQW